MVRSGKHRHLLVATSFTDKVQRSNTYRAICIRWEFNNMIEYLIGAGMREDIGK
jgi:hypothetical protein